jgi:hypothetical protein
MKRRARNRITAPRADFNVALQVTLLRRNFHRMAGTDGQPAIAYARWLLSSPTGLPCR